MAKKPRFASSLKTSQSSALAETTTDLSWLDYFPGYEFEAWDGSTRHFEPLKSEERREIVEHAILALTVFVPNREMMDAHPDEPAYRFEERVEPIYADGEIWRYQPTYGLWQKVTDHQIRELLRRWEGRALVERKIKRKKGEPEPEPTVRLVETGNIIYNPETGGWDKQMKEEIVPPPTTEIVPISFGKKGVPASFLDAIKDAIRTRTEIAYGPKEDGGFFAEAPKGMMFSDYFLFYDETQKSIECGHKSHLWRQRLAFPFPCPEFTPDGERLAVPAHPAFRQYLSSLWEGKADAAEREAQLAEFLGIAILGFATTEPFNKITFLHGPAGTGKSTFLQVAESVFPESALSHVSPHQFGNDNHLLMLSAARLNTVTEINESQPLGNFDTFKRVGSGEAISVCGKWKEASVVKPLAAHLFAVNDLPSIPGAPESLWARIMVMEIDRRFRNTKDCQLGIAKRIITEEKRAVLAWALNGGLAALQRGRFTVAPSSHKRTQEWRGLADNVGEFVQEMCEILPPAAPPRLAVPLKDAFAAYLGRCLSSGNKACTKSQFAHRLENLGIKKEKSGHIRFWMKVLTEEEIAEKIRMEEEAIAFADSVIEMSDDKLAKARAILGEMSSKPAERAPSTYPHYDLSTINYEALQREREEIAADYLEDAKRKRQEANQRSLKNFAARLAGLGPLTHDDFYHAPPR